MRRELRSCGAGFGGRSKLEALFSWLGTLASWAEQRRGISLDGRDFGAASTLARIWLRD